MIGKYAREQVVDLYLKGMPKSKIAERLGISRSSTYNILEEKETIVGLKTNDVENNKEPVVRKSIFDDFKEAMFEKIRTDLRKSILWQNNQAERNKQTESIAEIVRRIENLEALSVKPKKDENSMDIFEKFALLQLNINLKLEVSSLRQQVMKLQMDIETIYSKLFELKLN